MIDNNHIEILKSLSESEMNTRLLRVGIYLSAYEFIRSMIIEKTKFIHVTGQDFNGDYKYDPDYENNVLKFHKSPFISSAKYLCGHFGAINEDDVQFIIEFREYRNKVAHEVYNYILEDSFEGQRMLTRAKDMVQKPENFWMYIDIGYELKLQNIDVDWEKARGNSVSFIDHLITAIP